MISVYYCIILMGWGRFGVAPLVQHLDTQSIELLHASVLNLNTQSTAKKNDLSDSIEADTAIRFLLKRISSRSTELLLRTHHFKKFRYRIDMSRIRCPSIDWTSNPCQFPFSHLNDFKAKQLPHFQIDYIAFLSISYLWNVFNDQEWRKEECVRKCIAANSSNWLVRIRPVPH